MKIDTHIHLYDPEAGNFDWPEPGTPIYRRVGPEDFVKVATPHDISQSVVIACTTQPEQTELILDTMADHPSVGAVIGYSDVNSPDFIDLYERFCNYSKFRGFRFTCENEPNEQAMKNAAHIAGKHANVLEFLGTTAGIEKMRPFIEANPGVRFVIEHFAREQTDVPEVTAEFKQFLESMAAYKNVYLKTSALIPLAAADPAPTNLESYSAILEAAYETFGEDRCLFGSDWPLLELKGNYDTAVQVTESFFKSKSQAAFDKVMFQNAMYLYRILR